MIDLKKINISVLKKIDRTLLLQIGLGAAAVFCLILIIPQMVNASKTSKEVRKEQKVLSDLDNGIKNFDALQSELKSLDESYKEFLQKLPPQKEFPSFLELISQLAKKNNIKIISIEPQSVVDNKSSFYVRIPVFIDAFCGYHDLGRFINDLEFAPKLMRVETLEVNSGQKDADTQEALLTLNTYCLRDDEKLPAAN